MERVAPNKNKAKGAGETIEKEKMIHRKKIYWNFWRVVLAGWTIRYPKTMAKVVLLPLTFLIVLIYNAVVN
jgi:hypothetical protein